jgi:sortase A
MGDNKKPSIFIEPDSGQNKPVFSFKSDKNFNEVVAEVAAGAILNVEYVGNERSGHFKVSYRPEKPAEVQPRYRKRVQTLRPPQRQIEAAVSHENAKPEPMFPLPVAKPKVKNRPTLEHKEVREDQQESYLPPQSIPKPIEFTKVSESKADILPQAVAPEDPLTPRFIATPVHRPIQTQRRLSPEQLRGRTQTKAEEGVEETTAPQTIKHTGTKLQFVNESSQPKPTEIPKQVELLPAIEAASASLNKAPAIAPITLEPDNTHKTPQALRLAKSSPRHRKTRKRLLVAGILFLVVGAYLAFMMVSPQIVQTLPEESRVHALEQKVDEAPVPQDNRLSVPKMDMNVPISEGNTIAIIGKGGAWRLPQSSTPDQGGNTVIVGHRLTYTIPRSTFYYLDRLSNDDEVTVFWHGERYKYRVTEEKIVSASEVSVEAATDDARLTLYTCTPLWSLSKRLVIVAKPI